MSIIAFATADTGDLLELNSSFGSPSVQSAIAHDSGGSAYRLNPSAAGIQIGLEGRAADGSPASMNAPNVYAAVWVYVASRPLATFNFVQLVSTGVVAVQVIIQMQTDGSYKLFYANGSNVNTQIGSASAVAPTGAWHLLEFKATSLATGGSTTVEARLDGTVFATQSSLTCTSSPRNALDLRIGQSGGSHTLDVYVDTIIVDDAAYPGPCATQVLVPNAAGAGVTGWAGGTGSTFAEVDEVDGSHANDGDTTYLKSTALNDVRSFNLTNLSGTVTDIKCVVPFMICRDEGGASSFNVYAYSNVFTNHTTSADPGATYVYRATIVPLNPDGSVAWTATSVNAMQVGVENSANVAARVTAMGGFVIYSLTQTLSPPEATATAQGEVPAIGATLPAVAATATAQGEVPALGATLPAVAATATAQAEVPTIIDQASIAPPEATATAQAETPTMTATWTAVEATATARGEVPVLNATLAAVEATATAQAEAPRIEAGAAFGIGPFIGSASKAMLSIGKATRSILARGTATAFRPARGSARIRRPGDLP